MAPPTWSPPNSPKGGMGAGQFTGVTIMAGAAADRFGLVGFARHIAGPLRVPGAMLMIAALTLTEIRRVRAGLRLGCAE